MSKAGPYRLVLGETLTPDGPGEPFTLPVDVVTEAMAILAKRGSGKTYCAAVLTEQIVKAGQQVCVIDPTGAWWGLRSSADGEGDGLPFVIFGGKHADVPLQETAGKLIADLLVDEQILAVIDLSLMSKSAARRFMADFLERIYQRNSEPLHIVIDEADLFAPQRAAAEMARLLGAMEDLVRRGRLKGLGVTLITQRPAVIHKDVLSQVEILIVLRLTGTHDVKAIDEWVQLHADHEEAAVIKQSLPSLPRGTGWFWSPAMDLRTRVAIGSRWTFDSSKTPKVGERRIEPKRFAPVDLAALGEQMAELAQSAAGDDPKALRARVAELERELGRLTDQLEGEKAKNKIPSVTPEAVHRAMAQINDDMRALAERTMTVMAELGRSITPEKMGEAFRRAMPEGVAITGAHAKSPAPEVSVAVPADRPDLEPKAAPKPARAPARTPPAGGLPKAQAAILAALVQAVTPRSPFVTRARLSLLTGYSARSSSFKNAIGALRTAGLIEGTGDMLAPLPEGRRAAGPQSPLPEGDDLLHYWAQRLPSAQRAILYAVADQYPRRLSADEIARLTPYSPTSSSFKNAIGALRTLSLLEGQRPSIGLAREFAELVKGEAAA